MYGVVSNNVNSNIAFKSKIAHLEAKDAELVETELRTVISACRNIKNERCSVKKMSLPNGYKSYSIPSSKLSILSQINHQEQPTPSCTLMRGKKKVLHVDAYEGNAVSLIQINRSHSLEEDSSLKSIFDDFIKDFSVALENIKSKNKQ